MIVVGLAVLSVLISAGISLRAAGRLPADARVPVHMGIGGWDRYVSRRKGLWEWPFVVTFVGLLFSLMRLGGGGLDQPVPLPVYVVFVVPTGFILWLQGAAFREAELGGDQPPARGASTVPRWIALGVIGLALVPLLAVGAMFAWPRGGPPADVAVEGGQLVVTMRGPYKPFSLRSKIEVPLRSVVAMRVDPDSRN